MAAFPAATAGAANLAASYAAVQASLRKQFYGDLVELRGALLNTMSLAPHRAATLHPKMNLIDSALLMLEVRRRRGGWGAPRESISRASVGPADPVAIPEAPSQRQSRAAASSPAPKPCGRRCGQRAQPKSASAQAAAQPPPPARVGPCHHQCMPLCAGEQAGGDPRRDGPPHECQRQGGACCGGLALSPGGWMGGWGGGWRGGGGGG
jgi:hypothetical protein